MKSIVGLLLFLFLLLSNCSPKGGGNSMILLFGLLGRGSVSHLPSPGQPINLNGGEGSSTGTVTDVNGDGKPDGISTGNNGIPDIPLIDTNGDGVADAVDANGDGVADYYLCFHDGVTTLTLGPNCTGGQVTVVPGVGYDTTNDGVSNPDNTILQSIANDVTAPSSSIHPGAGTFASAQDVTITCSDNVAPGNIAYTTNGDTPTFSPIHGQIGGPPKVTFSVGSGGNGSYTIKYLCRDLAGNLQAGVQTAVFVIDDHLPDITTSNLNSQYVSNSSGAITAATFNWSSNRDGTYTIRLNSTSCTDGTVLEGPSSVTNSVSNSANINASSLSVGSNTLRICVIDAISTQTGQKLVDITRDDTSPSVTPNPTAGDYSSTQSVFLSCSDSSAGCDKIVYTTNSSDPTMTGSSGSITNGTKFTSSISAADSSITEIRYIARDNAGNVSSVVSSTYTVDSTVANVSITSASSSSLVSASSSATISWHSDKGGSYQLRIGGTDCSSGTALSNGGGNSNVTGTVSAGTTDTTSTIQNSSFSEGANTVRVCVSNLIGNFGSSTRTVTKDSTPPSVQSSTPADTSTGVAPNPGNITVVFSEDMKTDGSNPTLTVNLFTVDGTSSATGSTTNGTTFTWTDSKTLKIKLSWINFPENVKISYTLSTAELQDLAGNAISSFSAISFTTTVRQKNRSIADTGLTNCYNATTSISCGDSSFPRQDGDFSNTPSTRNFSGPTLNATFTSDATVKDNLTSLSWRNCITGKSSGTTCSSGTNTTGAWLSAVNLCAQYNVMNLGSGFAGKTNWRLPSSDELDTLPNYSLDAGTVSKIPSTLFANATNSTIYWSSTAYLGTGDKAYFLNGQGVVGFTNKTTATPIVLCVSE
ncbi:DUF1566 domain-containing protein [Leptospira semungkisensis]|uniref:DUF1566 domain-containing protein n=2 Tax=Leptospira semungkisensis TaxID=2484985 RepID=A0A4R9G5Y4_9LEPT|nr:DUF1566 domain-containing protein [Leptospira semungkisensis]